MSGARFVVLGLASVRAAWPRDVTGWAMAGAAPIEFIKCVSAEEVKARLRSGRRHSAVLLDTSAIGVDRDLLAMAREHDTAAIVVGSDDRDWHQLGADDRLHEVFSRQDLHERLTLHATPVGASIDSPDVLVEPERPTGFRGRLISVIGRTGGGVSTLAIAAAQHHGTRPATSGQVILADLALHGDQALLHDATDIVPGLQELTEAHRTGRMSGSQLRQVMYAVPARGYDLLLGLRRHHDWVAVRPRAFSTALDNVLANYRVVVADLSPDLEGEDLTGSIDIEERNTAARLASSSSDLVVVVGSAGLIGTHSIVSTIDALVAHDVDIERVVTVVNRAPRSARSRADIAAAIADLVDTDDRHGLASPVFIPERRHLDDALRNGTPLPDQIVRPLGGALDAAFERVGPIPGDRFEPTPQPVAAGSLGAALGLDIDGAAS